MIKEESEGERLRELIDKLARPLQSTIVLCLSELSIISQIGYRAALIFPLSLPLSSRSTHTSCPPTGLLLSFSPEYPRPPHPVNQHIMASEKHLYYVKNKSMCGINPNLGKVDKGPFMWVKQVDFLSWNSNIDFCTRWKFWYECLPFSLSMWSIHFLYTSLQCRRLIYSSNWSLIRRAIISTPAFFCAPYVT